MPAIKNITGVNWPASGAATAATIGIQQIGGGALSHLTTSDLPPGSLASSVLKQDAEGVSYIYPDANADIFVGSGQYTRRLWVKFDLEPTPPANGAVRTIVDFNGLGIRVQQNMYYRATEGGWNCTAARFVGGGTVENLATQGASAGVPVMMPGRWYEWISEIDTTAGDGTYRFYINGRLISQVTGLTGMVAGTSPAPESFRFWQIGMTGCRASIGAPLGSEHDEDIPIEKKIIRAPISEDDSTDAFGVLGTGSPRGVDFAHTLGGGITFTTPAYGTGGVHPKRRRLVYSGSGSVVLETTRDIGSLMYNGSGWACLVLPMTYLPGTGTATIAIRNAADDADLVSVEVDATSLKQGTTEIGTWDHARRYAIVLSLSDGGECSATLFDLTDETDTRQIAFSEYLSSWSPQTLGKLRISANIDTDAEFDGMTVNRYASVYTVDSMTSAKVSGITPEFYVFNNHIGEDLQQQFTDQSIINGGANFEDGRLVSLDCIVAARPGRGTGWWNTYILSGLRNSRAIQVIRLDGGSINDVGGLTNANRQAALATWRQRLVDAVQTVTANGNRFWLTTMIRREQGSYDATQLREIDTMNGVLRQVSQLYQRVAGGEKLVSLSDVAYMIDDHSTLFDVLDDHHFDAAGDAEYSSQAASLRTYATASVPSAELTSTELVAAVDGSTTGQNTTELASTLEDDPANVGKKRLTDGAVANVDAGGGTVEASETEIANQVIAGLKSSELLQSDLLGFVEEDRIVVTQADDYDEAEGTAWEKVFNFPGIDFTSADDNADFGAGVSPQAPLVEGTATVLNKANGSFTLRIEMTSAQTDVEPFTGAWTATITNNGKRLTVVSGSFELKPIYSAAPGP